MKNKVLFLAIAILGASSLKAQLNVGSTSAADASAILQATSTTKGFLPPVMTTTQINAIALPAKGLTVYNSTLSQLQINVGTPAVPSWSVAAGGANVYWSQLGNTGSNSLNNYIGTTDSAALSFRTKGTEQMRIDSSGNVGIGTTTPYAPLQFANTIANRKIVLADNGTSNGNDSAFYGFGINANTLRYQVPTGGIHSFYSNKTQVASIASDGQIFVAGLNSGLNFTDRIRTTRQNTLYSANGIIRLNNNINGDVFTIDSIGNTAVTGNIYTPGKITMGNNALQTITIGNTNSLVSTGNYNQSIGILAAQNNTTGTQNTFSGYFSGNANTTGSYNDFSGLRSGYLTTTGTYNTFHGYQSGGANTTGGSNVGIGVNAGPVSAALNNTISIGANVQATVSNTLILGTGVSVGIGTTTPAARLQIVSGDNGTETLLDVQANNLSQGIGIYYGGIRATGGNTNQDINISAKGAATIYLNNNTQVSGTIYASGTITQNSDRRLKRNIVGLNSTLAKVLQLMPYSYDKKNSIASTNYNMKEIGFIAQDVRKIFPQLVVEGLDSNKTLSVNYIGIIPILTKAIQEQQAQNDAQVAITKAQAKEIALLKKENISIAAQLADMKDMKIAMAAMQTELNKIAVTTKVAASNIVSK